MGHAILSTLGMNDFHLFYLFPLCKVAVSMNNWQRVRSSYREWFNTSTSCAFDVLVGWVSGKFQAAAFEWSYFAQKIVNTMRKMLARVIQAIYFGVRSETRCYQRDYPCRTLIRISEGARHAGFDQRCVHCNSGEESSVVRYHWIQWLLSRSWHS